MPTGPVQGNWRCEMYAAVTSQNNSSVTISCTAAIQTVNGYWYSGLTVRGSAGVNGQWANVDRSGVSVNSGQNVNMATKTLTVAKTKGVQTIQCGGEIRVTGYAAGVSSATMTVSVPALPSHRVTYDANGGSGAPGAQTKWYGEVLTLSGTRPTRANYTFRGWSTVRNGAVNYQPAGRYGADRDVTLYAVWALATRPPDIRSFSALRVDADGNPDSSGTSARFTADWNVDASADASNSCRTLGFAYKDASGAWSEFEASATSGSGTNTTTATFDGFDIDRSYQLRCTLTDKYATVTRYTTIGPARFIMDVSADGEGIGIGAPAPANGVNIYGTPVRINGCRMPRMFQGSTVITPSASSTRHTLFTEAQWASITGIDIDEGHPTVFVSNGDINALNVALTGAGYASSTRQWYVWCASAVSGMFRVNYVIFI